MKKTLLTALTLLSFNQSANAELIPISIGGGTNNAVYDNVLDITWLANGNLATSNSFGVSDIHSSGSMSWYAAHSWIAGMNSSSYLGINTWRLPTVSPLNGSSLNYNYTYDGSSDRGFNLSAPVSSTNPYGKSSGFTGSELAYMYYNNLGGKPFRSGNGRTSISTYGYDVAGIDDATNTTNLALFNNLKSDGYWTDSEWRTGDFGAVAFDTYNGNQVTYQKVWHRSVWAVADGNLAELPRSTSSDTADVPEPPIALLLLTGILSIVFRKLLKKK